MNKKQNYTIKIPETPKGVHMMMTIVPRVRKLQYSEHDIIAYLACTEGTYEERAHKDRGPTKNRHNGN